MTTISASKTQSVKGSTAHLSLEEKLKLVPLSGGASARETSFIPSAPPAVAVDNSDNSSRKKLALFATAAVLGTCVVAWVLWPSADTAQAPGAPVQASTATPAPVRAAPPVSALTASGYVVARRQATIAAQFTGQVSSILVTEGAEVSKGQLIARMDSSAIMPGIASANARRSGSHAQIAALDAELVAARSSLGRHEELAQRGFVARKDLEAAQSQVAVLQARKAQARADAQAAAAELAGARITSDQYNIRAPFAGTVIAINAQEGEIVSPISSGSGFTRTGICTIVDMNSLELEVDVSEAHISRVSSGGLVEISLSAYPETKYDGRVVTVVPIANRSTASFKVRIEVLNRDERMLPEMVANVRFLEV